MLVLFVILQMVGISMAIATMMVLQGPNTIQGLQSMLMRLPREAAQVSEPTLIPTALYSILLVWIGFRPNHRRKFWRLLLLAAGLAFSFVLIFLPIEVYIRGDWAEFVRFVQREPRSLLIFLAIVGFAAIGTALVSTYVMKTFLKAIDRRPPPQRV